MPYPSFSLEQTVPSHKCTKALLEKLERYLTTGAFASLVEGDGTKPTLKLTVKDSLGTDEYSSVDQFEADRFSDSTNRVEMDCVSWNRNSDAGARVRIVFAASRLFSIVAVSASAKNARELAIGIKDSIVRILRTQRTGAWFWNPPMPIAVVLHVLLILMIVLVVYMDRSSVIFPYVSWGLVAIALYLSPLRDLQPHVSFDSASTDRREKMRSWAIGGAFTFIVFGTLFTYVRKLLVGF